MLYHKDTLKACAAAASDDGTRPSIAGVRLDGKTATASDGHVLLRIENTAPPSDEFPAVAGELRADPVTVPCSALLEAAKATPKRSTLPVLECVAIGKSEVPESVRLVATDLDRTHNATVRTCPEPYPDCDAVFPTGEPVITLGLTVDVVLKLFKALKLAGVTTVSVRIYDPKRALHLRGQASNCASVEALLMPANLGDYGAEPPRE